MIDLSGLNLTYSSEEKAKKLLKYNTQRRFLRYSMTFCGTLGVLLFLYVFSNMQRYSSLLFSLSGSPVHTTPFDSMMLYALLVSSTAFYVSFANWRIKKTKYDTIRKNLIKNMSVSFCNCSYTCSCKERFIKIMKKYDIDLIFE